MDIKLKSSVFKSFRFEIVMYSLLSLIYTILSEAGIYFGFYVIRNLFKQSMSNNNQINSNLNNIGKEVAQYNNLNSGNVPPTNIGGMDGFIGHGGPPKKEAMILLIGFAIIIGIILFIIYFLLLTRKFVSYLDAIGEGIKELSLGNFKARVYIKNDDEFALIAEYLNKMADDISVLMENERKNEKAKNELITSVAHDLRTPLTSIIGYLDLASRKSNIEKETQETYISIAYEKSKRLEKLIEDLFSYTKYSSGEVSPNYQEIDMVKFMEQMVDEFYPSFQEAELEYEFNTSHSQAVVKADGDLLARAISNLISNAVKYGKDGKIIKIKLQKSEDVVALTITNYGEVIPEKDLENIFDRFFRVENSRSSETGGTGLGLAIAKKIILMHHGQISVKSDFEGTTFEVVLKLKKEEIENELEGKVKGGQS